MLYLLKDEIFLNSIELLKMDNKGKNASMALIFSPPIVLICE